MVENSTLLHPPSKLLMDLSYVILELSASSRQSRRRGENWEEYCAFRRLRTRGAGMLHRSGMLHLKVKTADDSYLHAFIG